MEKHPGEAVQGGGSVTPKPPKGDLLRHKANLFELFFDY